MEALDLTYHDPEEFEGKLLTYNGCEYVVGPYLGSGAQRIVHKLINRRSGLCIHVIKIWRSEEDAIRDSRHELLAKICASAWGYDSIPDLINVSAHGGTLSLQDYIGPYEEEWQDTHRLMVRADTLVNNAAQIPDAIALYEQVLGTNHYIP